MERELVKIVSDNPAFTAGYYTQFKDRMRPGDVIYGAAIEITADSEVMPLCKESIKQKPAKFKPVKRKVRNARTGKNR